MMNPIPLDDFISEDADHTGNARLCATAYDGTLCHVDQWGWMIWNGGRWVKDVYGGAASMLVIDIMRQRSAHASALRTALQQTVQPGQPAPLELKKCESIMKSCKCDDPVVKGVMARLAPMLQAQTTDFQRSAADLLNCNNGTIDLRTGELRPHDPKDRLTHLIPVDYDPDADMTMWEAFIGDTLANSGVEPSYLKVAAGYSITGETSEECLFYVYGPPRSGKGTFIEAIRNLLGDELFKTVDFASLVQKRDPDSSNFDLASWDAARFITAGEVKPELRLDSARINRMTGGDAITASHKFKAHFTFQPRFKVWLAANTPPNADPQDDAIWRRLKPIPFPNSQPESTVNKDVKRHYTGAESRQAVLRWLVEGAVGYYRDGLNHPDTVGEILKSIRDDSDTVQQWIDQDCKVAETDLEKATMTTNAALMASYLNFCKLNGITPKEQTGLTRALKAKGFKTGVQTVAKQTHRGVFGLFVA